MKIISHRGNTNGPSEKENDPNIITQVLKKYDCEIDVWAFDNDLYLGHDGADTLISPSFIYDNIHKLWCHAKNLKALETLSNMDANVFFHDCDEYTLTKHGYIWTAKRYTKSQRAVVVVPYKNWQTAGFEENVFGICVDYV